MTLEEARAIVALLDDAGTVHRIDCGTYGEDENEPGGEWYETKDGQRITTAAAATAHAMLAADELAAQQQYERQARSRPGPRPSSDMEAARAEAQELVNAGVEKNEAARQVAPKHKVNESTLRRYLAGDAN